MPYNGSSVKAVASGKMATIPALHAGQTAAIAPINDPVPLEPPARLNPKLVALGNF